MHATGADASTRAPPAAVAAALESNARNKAAGRLLLAQLPWQQKWRARARSAALLAVVAACFWPTVWAVAAICLAHRVWGLVAGVLERPKAARSQQLQQGGRFADSTAAPAPPGAQLPPAPRTAVVTGGKMTKALHVCRHLKAAGWRVVLVETRKYWHVGARFSRAVDAFATVPVPEEQPAGYARAIADIVEREGACLFIPVSSPISSLYDALAAEALPPTCRSWCLSSSLTAQLDNKASFSNFAASLGLSVPAHHTVTSGQELRELNSSQALGKAYILKSVAYDSVHRADLFKLPCPPAALDAYLDRPDIQLSLGPQQPWILQEFVEGTEYSCCTLAHNGRVVAHADTAAALSNLNYSFTRHAGIRAWVEQFVSRSAASGQLCFDFIEAPGGRLCCIECNPRTSSVVTEFHDSPELAAALTDPDSVTHTVLPLPSSRPVFWFFNEVARLLLKPGDWWRFLVVVGRGVDAVFDTVDPLPFLGLHFLQIPVLLWGNMLHGNPWTKLDVCIGKLAELHGD